MGKNPASVPSFNHKYHLEWTPIESGPPQWEADDCLFMEQPLKMFIPKYYMRLPSYDTVANYLGECCFRDRIRHKDVASKWRRHLRTEAINYVLWQLHPAPHSHRAFWNNLLWQG
jgi:hypothetical protein